MTPGLTLLGLLVVGIVAAESAEVRQCRQLTAERERLDRQLEAERERNAATLEHARELADFADLRALLDSAAVALHRTAEAMVAIRIALADHEAPAARDAPQELVSVTQELGVGPSTLSPSARRSRR